MDLAELLQQAEKLPPAQPMLPRLLRLLQDDDTGADEIVETIQLEPTLAASVLRLANSGAFGFPEPCHDLTEAVQRIGFAETYKLVAVVCGRNLVAADLETMAIARTELWESSLVTGFVMEAMAREVGGQSGIAYTTGLLHAIGKMVMNNTLGEAYQEVFTRVEADSVPVVAAEREIFGFDHAEAGAALLRQWKFPEEIAEPIAYQYAPHEAKHFPRETAMLHLAHWVVANLGYNPGKDAWAFIPYASAAEAVGIGTEQLEPLQVRAYDRIQEVKEFLRAANKPA